jgi:Tfp pilus assembly PilM family ATPase
VFALTKRYEGLEISPLAIRMVQVEKSGRGWRLAKGASIPLPEGTVKPSFKGANISDPKLFLEAVQRLMSEFDGKKSRTVGLSLPNEIVRMLIRSYPKLPDSRAEIEKLISWNLEKSFHFPIENTQVSYQLTGEDVSGASHLLVTLAMRDVIRQYQDLLAKLDVETRVVRPAGINLYNFFAPSLPQEGTHAFIGLFESYFNFLVFENDRLTFFHGVKRGFSDLQFFQDVDLTIQHYLESSPGKRIEHLSVGSQVGYHSELKDVLRNLIDIELDILREDGLIESGFDMTHPLERLKLSSFASALGAAQSIAQ